MAHLRFLPFSAATLAALAFAYSAQAQSSVSTLSRQKPATPPAYIGDTAIGTVAPTGSPLAGFTLAGGDDFSGDLSMFSSKNENARYFDTRMYGSVQTAGSLGNTAHGSSALLSYDTDPSHTGWGDVGYGYPIASMADLLTQSSGVLSLEVRAASTAERADTPYQEQLLGAALYTPGYMVGVPPFAFEARIRYTPTGGKIAGFHSDTWIENTGGANLATGEMTAGVEEYNGHEIDFETSATKAYQQVAQQYIWSAGSSTNPAAALLWQPVPDDGNWHKEIILVLPNAIEWFVDDQLVRTDAGPTTVNGYTMPYYGMFTAHGTTDTGYTLAAWQALTTNPMLQVDYFRFYRANSAVTRTAPAPVDIGLSWTAPWPQTFTLPSTQATWGSTGVTDRLEAIPIETEDPGWTAGGAWLGLPSWITVTPQPDPTKPITITVSQPPRAGRVELVRTGYQAGDVVSPQRIHLHVGPAIDTPATVGGITGAAMSIPLWQQCDTGGEGKVIAVSALPTGWSISQVGLPRGVVSGTLSSAFTFTETCSTVTGFTASKAITVQPVVAGAGVPFPILPGGAPIASLDFDNLSSLTLNGSLITAVAGADGTTPAATQATASLQPTSTKIGNHYAATFGGTQYLDWSQFIAAYGSAIGTAKTIVVIEALTATSGNETAVDIGNALGTSSANRSSMFSIGATNWTWRTGATTGDASNSSPVPSTTGVHLWIGRRDEGSSSVPTSGYVDGTLAAAYGATPTVTATPPADTATIGAMARAATAGGPSSYGLFMIGNIYRVVIFPRYLSDAEIALVQAWKTNAYGN